VTNPLPTYYDAAENERTGLFGCTRDWEIDPMRQRGATQAISFSWKASIQRSGAGKLNGASEQVTVIAELPDGAMSSDAACNQ
jgi:hypothetical protein